jgi:serine/threonine protein kinase
MSFVREPNAEPIPGYRLIEPLGSGGFGEAWKCEAPGGIFKAIKFVFGNLNSLDVDGFRAEQELKALNRVKEVRHPFVLQMDRIEVVGGELVIVMELADKNLHDAYEEFLSAGLIGIPRDTLLRYIRDAAEALDHMNEKHGLQHLDIKPRNLFLVSDRVKVADFGLVKHLERSPGSGIMGGVTPLYAPPETFTGTVSDRSDQYSLAIVYQELLTGQRPFNGKNARQLANQHMNEPPDLRALPEADRLVVARALEKEPNKRFPNCLAFVRGLYTARSTTYANLHLDEGNQRPKTMIDTLENFQLEQAAEDQLVPVELGIEIDAALSGSNNSAGSQLGITIAQPQTGSLRPTLLLGVGGAGRRALSELRCRLIDRFGDLDKVPMFRFLYIDTDPEAIKAAQRGAPELAFRASEVYHLTLQPVSHYRRRQLDQLSDWLPREKLYALPRSLKTQGSRALGRLAFTDHYQRLLARLKRDLQQACHPDAVFQTVSQTGLAVRDNVPRIYIIAGATGGASGYLADLGYATRRLTHQMRQPDAPIIGLLFCGAPDDPATPRAEQANLYATLTELNHFSDPAIPFSAQYGPDGPRLVDEGPAFDLTYLLMQQHRSPESRRDTLAHFGSYLFHELTTPLGLRLDQSRSRNRPDAPFRSLGTFGVWFPRGLLLRLAARSAVQQLLDDWQSTGPNGSLLLHVAEQQLIDLDLSGVFADPDLSPELLGNCLADHAATHLDGQPREVLTQLLVNIEEQSSQTVALEDPGVWARQVLERVRNWLGSGVSLPGTTAIHQRRSGVTKALEAAAATLGDEWDQRLTGVVGGLLEHPGRRVLVAEAALTRLIEFIDEIIDTHKERLEHLAARSQQAERQLETALQNCLTGGGWSWFGSRSRRQLRIFMDHLAVYARQCLAEDNAAAVVLFLHTLRGRLADRVRDLAFCRQRLRHMQEVLLQEGESDWEGENVNETMTFSRTPATTTWGTSPSPALGATPAPLFSAASFWESIRASSSTRVVLPAGQDDLEIAARAFLATLTGEHWQQLDQASSDLVLVPRSGLLRACLDTNDLVRHLLVPLLNQAMSTLSLHLPITDVAQVEVATGPDLAPRIRQYHAAAVPLVYRPLPGGSGQQRGVLQEQGSGVRQAVTSGGRTNPDGFDITQDPQRPIRPHRPGSVYKTADEQFSFLLIPVSDAGRAFGEVARETLQELLLVNVPGQADLMFCREQTGLKVEDLERILRTCRAAYQDSSSVPVSSPHARFDIQDWTPLDP